MKPVIVKIKIVTRIWSVRFIPQEMMRDSEWGTCWSLKRVIDIDNSLNEEEAKIILGHELTHAFLTSFGKLHERNFIEEEICDFVTWNADEIVRLRDYVMKERKRLNGCVK